jgi:nanoRNase/pAp phosphatase (c-di-AMP/oligoRNAs hydrolase)
MIYALYPQANVWMNLFKARGAETVVISLGHSILNRSCNMNVGHLLAQYGGGGHRGAGTCQVPKSKASRVIKKILEQLKEAG